MSKVFIYSLSLLAVVTSGCMKKDGTKEEVEKKSPTDLSSLSKTSFVTTLESPIDSNQNIIYTPTFHMAWKGLEEVLGDSITAKDKSNPDIFLLNHSNSYLNSLDKDEYQSEVENDHGDVSIHVFFNKKLPFPKKLQKTDSIEFDHVKFLAFGMKHFDEEITKFVRILFYQDDDHFILRLAPKDTNHEIILAKGIDNKAILTTSIKKINELIEIGHQEQVVEKSIGNYVISELDDISIPVIQFDIQENYKNLEGKEFFSKGISLKILDAYQRNDFLLNENGAVVESEARVKAKLDSVDKIAPTPKRMIFDKPYVILIKHVDRENPYFVMRVSNNELLKVN